MGVLCSYPSFFVASRECAKQRWEMHIAGELYVCYDVTETLYLAFKPPGGLGCCPF